MGRKGTYSDSEVREKTLPDPGVLPRSASFLVTGGVAFSGSKCLLEMCRGEEPPSHHHLPH